MGRSPPAVAYTTRPKAAPNHQPDSEYRVRHDRVDKAGKVTLRHNSRLHHIGIGRPLAGTLIVMLIHDLHIRIIHAATGELIRQFNLDPDRQYEPTGKPRGGPSRPYGPYGPRKKANNPNP